MFIVITLFRRKIKRLAIALFLVAALAAPFLAAEYPPASITVAVTPELYQYLTPYYRAFARIHPHKDIEFIVTSRPSAARPDSPAAFLVPIGEKRNLPGTRVATLQLRFATVVSPFNPIDRLDFSQLQKILTGRLQKWSAVSGDLEGQIEIISSPANPAEPLLPRLFDSISLLPASVQAEDLNHLARLISTNPKAIAVIPLHAVEARTNLVEVTDEPANSGVLECPVAAIQTGLSFLPEFAVRWLRKLQPGQRALDSFLSFVREKDQQVSRPKSFTLTAVGDIMLDRRVAGAIRNHDGDVTYPFRQVQPMLSEADVTFANLETPISNRGWLLNMFRADPKVVEGLAFAGIDVVSIANNHILDFDDPAMEDTIALLQNVGIKPVGAGKNLAFARKPAIINVKGRIIAFLAYTELWFCHTKTNRRYDATDSSSGVAPLREDYIVEDVKKAAKLADLVVVSFHWGKEYHHFPTETQKKMARLAIDAGAHLIFGHHPHVLQGIEFYRGGVIAYSLGNFVFDQTHPGTRDTVALTFTLSGSRVLRLDISPGRIVNCQPRFLAGKDKRRALQTLLSYSAE